MAEQISLTATARSATGKGAARKARAAGNVPGVVYGHGRTAQLLTILRADLDKTLAAIGDEARFIELNVDGKGLRTLIREIQRHPIRLDVIHIDFLEIQAGEKITVRAPIHLVGTPEGVRNQGGVLDQSLRELEIRVLPKDLPDHIEVDVTELTVGSAIHVGDVTVPNAEVLEDAARTVCSVAAPRVEAEPVVAEAVEEEGVEEPELIRKPKAEGEEGETEAEGE